MICKRIRPAAAIERYVKEYLLLHVVADSGITMPVKSYPVNPEEGITLVLRGSLEAENPLTRFRQKRPQVSVFGLPAERQNLIISNEYMMFHIRFQPGAMHMLLKISMTELLHTYIDASILFGKEILSMNERLCNTTDYELMPGIVNAFFTQWINRIKINERPSDRIGMLINNNPKAFSLDRMADEACLSVRQFEKRFVRQFGVPPKHYARICRFYQSYEIKEHYPDLDWLSIAVRTGYNDYQHLVKDFKQFAGTTPNVLIRETLENPERRFNIDKDFRGL